MIINVKEVGPYEEGMIKSIKIIADVFDFYNVSYWLVGGALLGLIRNQKLLPWDDDVEIGLWMKDKEKVLSLFEQFNEQGLEITVNKYDKIGLHLQDGLNYKIRLLFFDINKDFAVRVKLDQSHISKYRLINLIFGNIIKLTNNDC